MDDMRLVQQFALEKSEEAFAALVSRHVNLVYSVAFRQAQDTHLAEEITQTVFVILARKAGSLGPKTVVAAWLCQTARYVAARALTMQNRRTQREQEAYMQSQLKENESDAWRHIEPLLDKAMAGLGEKDHGAVVLRFFEDKNFNDIGKALGTTEAGAKMRVNRALEKLRMFFTRRGLTFSTALIAASISANSVKAAPAGLATSAVVSATKGIAFTSANSTLIETTLKIMTWTKLKAAIVVGIIAILAAGTAIVAIREIKTRSWSASLKFTGYSTPEASVESMIWAAGRGEPMEKLAVGMTDEQMGLFKQKMAGKSAAEFRQGCIAWAHSLTGYKITEKEVISDDEVHLHIHAMPSADGLHTGHTVLIMRKENGVWKFAGNAS
ncbi:MAG: sigma-70 family RNA polymerase sigma factor [Verrucomicrobiota bacterium]